MSEQCGLKLSCPICRLGFGAEDSVCSTSCGHIFHVACFNVWKTKSTSCPQCRSYNPTSHRVYLNYETEVQFMGTWTSNESKKKITDLEREVQEKQILLQKVESDFNKFQKSSKSREDGLSKLVCQQQLERQKVHNMIIDVNQSFEGVQKEVDQLLRENAALKTHLQSIDGPIRKINKALEEKLKHVTTELEKERAKNTEISTHVKPQQQNSNEEKKAGQKTHTLIAIQKLPLDQVKHPLENIVVTLAQKMNVKLYKDQIEIVGKEERNMMLTLWVRFKNEKSKQKFLMCKDLLKNKDGFQLVQIAEINKKIRPLFYYANKKLRGKGFNYIALKSDAVIAKKNIHDQNEIVIKSRGHVDDLLKNATK